MIPIIALQAAFFRNFPILYWGFHNEFFRNLPAVVPCVLSAIRNIGLCLDVDSSATLVQTLTDRFRPQLWKCPHCLMIRDLNHVESIVENYAFRVRFRRTQLHPIIKPTIFDGSFDQGRRTRHPKFSDAMWIVTESCRIPQSV